jgi:hypothetical protein
MGNNACCSNEQTDKVNTDTKLVDHSEKMRQAAPAHHVEPVSQNKPALLAKPAEPQPPVQITPKIEPKVEEVKVDEHAGAVDYEKASSMNQMASAVKKTFESKRPRSVKDYPELKEHYATPTQILRNKKTGDTYNGGVLRGVPHGWGLFVTKQGGEVLEGVFLEGHHANHMRQIQADGTAYEGDFKNQKREGKGIITRADGSTLSCNTWVNGNATGSQEETDNQGHAIFKGIKSEKGPEGNCYISGKDFTLEGTFKDGVPTAATKKYNDGRLYAGALDKNFVEEGQGTITLIDGRKFAGNFNKGKPNGDGKFTSDTGKVSNQTWKDGKRA